MYIFEILKTSGKRPFSWRIKASNGQILLTSGKYVKSPVKTVEKFTKRMQPGTFLIVIDKEVPKYFAAVINPVRSKCAAHRAAQLLTFPGK